MKAIDVMLTEHHLTSDTGAVTVYIDELQPGDMVLSRNDVYFVVTTKLGSGLLCTIMMMDRDGTFFKKSYPIDCKVDRLVIQ